MIIDDEYRQQFEKFKRALDRNADEPAPLPNRGQPRGKTRVLDGFIREDRRAYDEGAAGFIDNKIASNQRQREEGMTQRAQAAQINATPLTRPPTARVRRGMMG